MKNIVDVGHEPQDYLKNFFKQESAAGILLMLAATLAIIIANTPLTHYYQLIIDTPVVVQVGKLEIAKPLLLWVNDGLMAVFFLLVGLELKREFIEGELANKKNIILPGLGAIGGMFVPAGVYVYFNYDDPIALQGWAIPAATDIAFALGILSLLGSKVPTSLKIFLTSLAIFDDVGAILIIAFFYTSKVSLTALIVAALCIGMLFVLNRSNIIQKSLYLWVGLIMWVALLKSGVHATLGGVILALFIPIGIKNTNEPSPLKTLEHDLHSLVAFFILPVFAFCNAGINFTELDSEQIFHPVPIGIALGLLVGKPIGVFLCCWLGIKLKLTTLPEGMNYLALLGMAALCGVGFTMSLFIGSLAFEETGVNLIFDERLGILIGSILSGLLGYFLLKFALQQKTT